MGRCRVGGDGYHTSHHLPSRPPVTAAFAISLPYQVCQRLNLSDHDAHDASERLPPPFSPLSPPHALFGPVPHSLKRPTNTRFSFLVSFSATFRFLIHLSNTHHTVTFVTSFPALFYKPTSRPTPFDSPQIGPRHDGSSLLSSYAGRL